MTKDFGTFDDDEWQEKVEDTAECPNCGQVAVCVNGFNYECPDCGYEWDKEEDDDVIDFEEDIIEDEEVIEEEDIDEDL
ncbi:MAG: hypothetical protein LBP19_05500 [Treponema sp.]|jgi:rubredoxin|nr:hypothetical protein [Treponema sp.]